MCIEVFFKLLNMKNFELFINVLENVVIVIINGVLIILFIFIEFFYVFNFNDIGLIIYKFEMFY